MLDFCQCSQKKRTGAASRAAPSCSDSDSEVRCPTPSPVRYRTIVLYLGKPGVQATADALVYWYVRAKYRTIVPKLGTPGKPCSSFQAAGQQRGANNRRNLPVLPRATADWAGHPERTIIRLPGFPSFKNEQSFGCPDFPVCSTNKKARAFSSGFCPKVYLLSK